VCIQELDLGRPDLVVSVQGVSGQVKMTRDGSKPGSKLWMGQKKSNDAESNRALVYAWDTHQHNKYTSQRDQIHHRAELQKTPSSHIDRQIPLIHLPLAVPTKSVSTLTPWLHISFDLNTLIPLFQALPRAQEELGADDKPAKRRKVHSADVPAGHLGYVSYVRVYANCRVRRIWFVSREGEGASRSE